MFIIKSAEGARNRRMHRSIKKGVCGRPVSRRRRRSGFTLLEVVVAIFALAAASGVFFAMMPASLKTGKMVGNHQQASSLVQHKVDQLRGVGWGRLNYTELLNAGIIDADPTVSPYSFELVDDLDSIYVDSVATIKIENASPTIKKVTVTLTWSGSASRQGNGTLTASALIAQG